MDLGRIFTDERGRCKANITLNLRELESKGLFNRQNRCHSDKKGYICIIRWLY